MWLSSASLVLQTALPFADRQHKVLLNKYKSSGDQRQIPGTAMKAPSPMPQTLRNKAGKQDAQVEIECCSPSTAHRRIAWRASSRGMPVQASNDCHDSDSRLLSGDSQYIFRESGALGLLFSTGGPRQR